MVLVEFLFFQMSMYLLFIFFIFIGVTLGQGVDPNAVLSYLVEDLLLQLLHLLLGQDIRFGDYGDDIHLVVELLHEFYV